MVHGVHAIGDDTSRSLDPNGNDTPWLTTQVIRKIDYRFSRVRLLRYCYNDDPLSPNAISKPNRVRLHALRLSDSILQLWTSDAQKEVRYRGRVLVILSFKCCSY